jgi:threonylcarbamoyladenosine tRNA methylthiotransferase MtaB
MSVDVITFGCRLNAFESEVIAREAERAGLADTIVINSCAVTNEAVAQARQSIRRLKRERPEARIVVTGCAAQTQAQMFADMAEVDRVVGNDDKMRGEAWCDTRTAFDAAPAFGIAASEKIAVADIMAVKEMAPHLLEGFQKGLPRVFVQVQNGCDHRCTFCIIPYGRGNSRSVPMGAVVDQVRALVARGHAEIVLTGVDLTSYGVDLPGTPKLGLLTKQILRHVPELKRLRISSIDQVEVDKDLLDVIADDERLMPHLHLSLQSGDDLILKRMKRRHSRADAVDFCAQVRRLRPDIALGADIIAGFPTETEEMLARSQDLVEECDLTCMCSPTRSALAPRRRGCRRSPAKKSGNVPGDCGPREKSRCKSGWHRKWARRGTFSSRARRRAARSTFCRWRLVARQPARCGSSRLPGTMARG